MSIKMAQKELDVLSLLLRSEKPMAISDIVATNPDYTINMIKPIIRTNVVNLALGCGQFLDLMSKDVRRKK